MLVFSEDIADLVGQFRAYRAPPPKWANASPEP
jgi:hypothetical protein